MRLLISGICGFVGSVLARSLRERHPEWSIAGFDNFIRPGSECNRLELRRLGITVHHADLRHAADLEGLPPADWIIDAAALPSVLAGVDGKTSSRQLIEHNLLGTVNLLELCRRWQAGFVLLSTSRVYSLKALAALPVRAEGSAFRPDLSGSAVPTGLGPEGISEQFPIGPPASLYGASKLASETLAIEYGETFSFPVWINRCGVMAGAGQFGRADQGIFAYWIHSWAQGRPLRYLGFSGDGRQTRDCLHPRDLAPLLEAQLNRSTNGLARIQNVSGGAASAMSLAELSAWCADRFGPREVGSEPATRLFDAPWIVLDSSLAADQWQWRPQTSRESILEEIARHAEAYPHWLDLSTP
jgi:CDP-paratose 2-epimerase